MGTHGQLQLTEIFVGVSGPQNNVQFYWNSSYILNFFLISFLYQGVVDEASHYAYQFSNFRGFFFLKQSSMEEWHIVTVEEVFIVMTVFMLMEIVERPNKTVYLLKSAGNHSCCWFSHFCGHFWKHLQISAFWKQFFQTCIWRTTNVQTVSCHNSPKFKMPEPLASGVRHFNWWIADLVERLPFVEAVCLTEVDTVHDKNWAGEVRSCGYVWSFIVNIGKAPVILKVTFKTATLFWKLS